MYVRVSTTKQDHDMQVEDLKRLCAFKGFTDVRLYQDKDRGQTIDREAITRLISDVEAGLIDVVICWKLDRLFRSVRHTAQVLNRFTELGVDFISFKENIDLKSTTGRLMVNILAAFAEFEGDVIGERIRAGLAAKAAKGEKVGPEFKYDKAAILLLKEKGFTASSIAKEIGCSKKTVYNYLTNHKR